jgi:photosystem II stability/assembly factor-like uncharacterized protein
VNVTRCLLVACALGQALVTGLAGAQPQDPRLFAEMRWRMIGPHRGGRTKAAAGVSGQPGLFYIGVCNGGVWKTTDYGRTWAPIFDNQSTGSIGAIAVAPSDPRIIYVGSGEGLQRPDLSTGDGIYRSVDAGRSWTHLGLRDGQQIPQIIVDPRNPDRLFVAVLGHPYGPNEERGIFRSSDGGRSFERVLYRDPDTGGVDIAFDPSNPDTIYAVLWEARQAPWENGAFSGPGSGIFKSTDGGKSWRPIGKGLPTFAADGLGRIGIGVAPSLPRRLFATVEARQRGGLYRSDDAGESWYRVTEDGRVTARASDFAEVKVHPQNPDIVFTGSVVTWKSVDGGKTFAALRGAPGGDDYHRIWIDPRAPDIMLIASDQGAIVTVNGGRSWSSWYNQPTAQLYHVTTDNAFPYRVCGGQQESGSACVASRGPDGQVTFRDWRPVGAEEYAYVAPDPLDPDIVYGGRVTRFDRRTGQTQSVAPVAVRGDDYRVLRTAPLLFSLADPRALYFASNVLWRTRDGGRTWARLSPDLTRQSWAVPASVGKYRASEPARPVQRGVIYTIAPSPLDRNTIWVGSDDGLIHVTTDGGRTWQDVTPPEVKPWAKVSLMDAGRFDRLTAYAAVNTFRLDDLRPHIYRTHDGGKSWTAITAGIPDGGIVNVVREDPKRRGLLFAGSERAVHVSFDDGAHWQSLRLDMPPSSIRDLVIKDDDLVVATHGRSFWILDDITPLRQLGAGRTPPDVWLFRPQEAIRVRWNTNEDTPLPPDEPTGGNPPEGAIIDYYLAHPAARVTLEIADQAGRPVRRFSSADQVEPPRDEGNIPAYWIRRFRAPPAQAGHHRVTWDLRGEPPAVLSFDYPIAAVPGNTLKEPRGPWVLPGQYTVKLTVGAVTTAQPLTVKMDPRLATGREGIARQHRLSLKLIDDLARDRNALEAARAARAELRARRQRAPAESGAAIDIVDRALAALAGSAPERGSGSRSEPAGLVGINAQLASLYKIVQQSDRPPTPQAEAGAIALHKKLAALLDRWQEVRTRELPALQRKLDAGPAAIPSR